MNMPSGKQTESLQLAAAVAAEIRAALGRHRISGNQLAQMTGISQNYVAKRLRDEAPFTLNDVQRICEALDEDYIALINGAAAHIKKAQ